MIKYGTRQTPLMHMSLVPGLQGVPSTTLSDNNTEKKCPSGLQCNWQGAPIAHKHIQLQTHTDNINFFVQHTFSLHGQPSVVFSFVRHVIITATLNSTIARIIFRTRLWQRKDYFELPTLVGHKNCEAMWSPGSDGWSNSTYFCVAHSVTTPFLQTVFATVSRSWIITQSGGWRQSCTTRTSAIRPRSPLTPLTVDWLRTVAHRYTVPVVTPLNMMIKISTLLHLLLYVHICGTVYFVFGAGCSRCCWFQFSDTPVVRQLAPQSLAYLPIA